MDDELEHSQPTERRSASEWRRFGLAMLVFVPMFVMWSLTTAMFGSPDETVHMVRAQSFASLDLVHPFTTDGLPIESVECFRFRPEITAACQDLTWGEPGTERDVNVGDYPPVFHAVVAVPATVTSGLFGAYAMRVWMAVVNGALFSWAVVLATRPGTGRWPLIGLLFAVSPMVAFTAGTVNTTGVAAAGTALVTLAALELSRGGGRPDRSIAVAAVVGVIAFVGTRRDAVLWLGIVAVALAPLVSWRTFIGRLRERRPSPAVVWPVAIAAAVLLLGAALFFRPTVARFYRNWSDGMGGGFLDVLRSIPVYIEHLIGRLGWLDTPIGDEATMTVIALVGFLVVAAMLTGPVRLAISTGLALVALLLVPLLFGLVRFPYLQGRYLVPIWVAMCLIAATAIARGELSARAARRAVPILLLPWALVHVGALVLNLRRYAVGRYGPWDMLTDPDWSPPMMSNGMALALIGLAGIISVAATVALVRTLDHTPVVGPEPRREVTP